MSSLWVAPLGTDPEDLEAWKCIGNVSESAAFAIGLEPGLTDRPYEAHPTAGKFGFGVSFAFVVGPTRSISPLAAADLRQPQGPATA